MPTANVNAALRTGYSEEITAALSTFRL